MLYVTRHGETEWNRLNKVMGRQDEPLNDNGIAQAHKVGKLLEEVDFDMIISSPLIRARQTAAIINEKRNIELAYDERIIERDFGEFDGFRKEEFPYFDFWDYGLNKHYTDAENIRDFFDRVYGFLEEVKLKHKKKNILLVTHGGVSMPIDCYFKGHIPKGHLSGTGLALQNCQVRKYEL